MNTPEIDFYLQQVAGHALSLPWREAQTFLSGALQITNHESAAPLRQVYAQLSDCDLQLQLIAAGEFQPPAKKRRAA